MIDVRDNIDEICMLLNAGKVILYPTDTVWGIGCDATNVSALKRLFNIRERDLTTPLTILVDGITMLRQYVEQIHPRVETLLSLHERPLTIVYPENKNLPGILLQENQLIGFRIVQDAFCAELISSLGKPLIAHAANDPGKPYPRHFGEISSEIINAVDYVVKYGQEDPGEYEPSVIATYDENGQLDFIRS